MEKVSFTSNVKEEITLARFSIDHLRALLAAFIKINGSLNFANKKASISLKTENAKIAKFIYSTLQHVYKVGVRFAYLKAMNFKRKTVYHLYIENDVEHILDDLEISFLDGKIAKNMIASDDMIAGYLAGAFLASGSVNSPHSSNYHLEIALNDANYAKWFLHLFSRYHGGQFTPKTVMRRNYSIVYLKRSDQIADFLILIGATNSALDYENIRIDRDFANIGNRLQNLDVANLDKTMNAAKRQIEEIKIIEKALGSLDNLLNPKLTTLMRLRLEHDDCSLQELAFLLSKELDEPISRSNINHMLRNIHEMAMRYKGVLK